MIVKVIGCIFLSLREEIDKHIIVYGLNYYMILEHSYKVYNQTIYYSGVK